MFSPYSHEKFGSDLFNHSNYRNIKNTPKSWYNCGGYALKTFSWYLPSDDVESWGGFIDEEDYEEATAAAVKVMLRDFPTLRVVQNENEVMKDEYCIAFRISYDGDFHYVRKAKNGVWYHKLGGCQWIDTFQAEQIYSECWFGRYDGPLVLFAKKI